MRSALAVLTVAAFLTLAFGVAAGGGPLTPIAPGAAFTVLGTVGFARVQRRPGTIRTVGYVTVQLLLGYLTFAMSGASVAAVLLLIVLVSQSVLLLPLPGAVAVVALVPLAHTGMSWRDGLREGLGLLAAAVFAAVLTHLLVREQRARAALAQAHRQLRDYALQAERLAAVQERNRVARDIHDGVGHALTVVQMQVQAARAVLEADPRRADAVLAKAQHQAGEALAEIRRSVAALREPRSVPLPEALREMTEELSATGVPARLEVTGDARELTPDTADTLYRAAQEGLTNIRRHAGATRVEVTLDYTRPAAVRLEVRDDGAGMPAAEAAAPSGYGLLGVRERAAGVGGSVHIDSAPGKGTTLRVGVPG